MSKKTLLTKEGYQLLVNELAQLKDKRYQLVTRLEEVAQPDETGEDGLATQLKEELELVLSKIEKLEEAVEGSKIISQAVSIDSVGIGCRVKIKYSDAQIKEFHIVSEFESNPMESKISDQSPLGQALMGKKVNETIDFQAPVGKITYKIISISR